MEFVYLNIHADDFILSPPHFWLFKRKSLCKYNYLVENSNQIFFMVDYRVSAFLPYYIFQLLPFFIRYILIRFELFLWLKCNENYNLIEQKSENFLADKILFSFSFKSLTSDLPYNLEILSKFKLVIFHLSHYHVDLKLKAQNAEYLYKNLSNYYLAFDVDIKKNKIFNAYYNWYQKNIILISFVVSKNHLNHPIKSNRQNKILATGSLHKYHLEGQAFRFKDYIDFTGVNYLHSIRQYFFYFSDSILINYISFYKNYSKNYFSRLFNINQKKYFSFNLLEEMCKYKYLIAGEETIGAPSIVAIEGLVIGMHIIGEKCCYDSYPTFIRNRIINFNCDQFQLINLSDLIHQFNQEELSNVEINKIRDYFSSNSTYKRILNQLELL